MEYYLKFSYEKNFIYLKRKRHYKDAPIKQ